MEKKPNIVLILIDDLGWVDWGCYESTFYETPHIDRLAVAGMRFTNAYSTCPVCSAARASILTGRYPARIGLTDYIGGKNKGKLIDAPYIDHLPLSERSIATVLKEHGYDTWHVGKWHLGGGKYNPTGHGFTENIGGSHWGMAFKGYFNPWNIPTIDDDDAPEGTYLTDYLTDKAIELINNRSEKPYLLNLWFYSVHVPIMAKPEKIEYFKKKKARLGLDKIYPFELGDNFPTKRKKDLVIRRRKLQSSANYAAMVHSVDENVGKIMKTIEESGESDNTIIFLTSDNGGLATAEGSPTCNYPLSEGKGWMYEGGVRDPLIVKWKGELKENSICDTPVIFNDFYPTFLELAGIDLMPEQHTDGVSILPLLKEKDGEYDRCLFWHYPHYGNQGGTPGSSIRKGDYKLIEFFEDNHVELYNLKKDLEENHDISKNYPAITGQLRGLLEDWRFSIEAKIPKKNPKYSN
jgi:arylsulfatase A-like enzyme